MNGKKVIILGAGPAGLAAGLELVKNGYFVQIVERDNFIGGIAKTIEYKGYRFDVGGHRFFTKNDEVNALWHETLKKDFKKTPRLSRIFYNKKFFPYPIKLAETLQKAGIFASAACLFSFIRFKIAPVKPEKSFADWVTNRFGKKLFTMFFKSYTEKVWGIPTDKLSAEWAAQRIKGLSLWETITNALFSSKKKAKSLIEEFDYPRLGPGYMYEEMAKNIISKGGQVLLNRNIVEIKKNGSKIASIKVVDEKGNEENLAADYFISTIPLPDTVNFIRPALPEAAQIKKELKFRDFISVNLILDKEDVFPDTWIYIHDPAVVMGRIQNFKNWSKDMTKNPKHSPIGCEYFCNQNDKLWNKKDEDLIELAKKELETIGLAKASDVIDGLVYRMRDAYPVYMGKYQQATSKAREILARFSNLQVAGRGGMFRYNNMDHSILAGLYAARNLLGEKIDIWKINEDADYHEQKK